MKVTSFLNFGIIALFLTDLWIILYVASADFAYFAYHPSIQDWGFSNPALNPEPFKIYLYLFYTGIFTLLLLFVSFLIHRVGTFEKIIHNKFFSSNSPFAFLSRLIIFLTLFAIFINKLGNFPLSSSPGHFSLKGFISAYPQPDTNLVNFILLVYISFIGFMTTQATILKTVVKNQKIFLMGAYAITLTFIAVVTFDAKFTIPTLDAAFFYGPVWEITHGKTLLTDVTSTYGFLSIFLFAAIHSITQLNFVYLPIIIWILYCIEYFIGFYLVLRVSRSIAMGFLCLFSLITINYFGVFHNPQFGPLRWVPHFIVLLMLARYQKIDAKILIFAVSLLSLWNIDSGFALLLAYITTLGLMFLLKKINLKRIFLTGGFLLLSFLIIFSFLQGANLLFHHKPINFLNLYSPLFEVSRGSTMRPLQTHTYFWFLLLIYFSSIIYFLKTIKNQQSTILLFSANLMFFAGNYYVGESFPHNVINLSPLILFTFFLLVSLAYQDLRTKLNKGVVVTIIFLLLIVYPALMKKEFLTNEIVRKFMALREGSIFTSELDQLVNEEFRDEAELISKNISDDSIIINSSDDTYLFYLTGKGNLLNINPATYINTKTQMEIATKNLNTSCPKKIVTDCQIVNKCPSYNTITHGAADVQRIILAAIENKCKVQYKPVICTDKLCIGDSQI